MAYYLVKSKIDTHAEVVVEASNEEEAKAKASKDDTVDDWSYDTDYDSSTIYEVIEWSI
jgi:hypothetical protein